MKENHGIFNTFQPLLSVVPYAPMNSKSLGEETLRAEHAAAGSALEKMEEARMCGLAGLWKVACTHGERKVKWLFQVVLVNG